MLEGKIQSSNISITRWITKTPPIVSELENQLKNEGLSPFIWTDSEGSYYPTHSHPYTEIRWIIDGTITVGIHGEEIILYPGDRLELKPYTEHYTRMSDDKPTIYLCASKQE